MQVGQQVGPYRVVKPLGQGCMGAVYLVEHPDLGRYALKTLTHVSNANTLPRFQREMEVMAGMERHANVIGIHTAGVLPNGLPYFVMDYVEGRSLTETLRYGVTVPQALEYAEQIARGLLHAHSKGVVHRDLKPDNVLIDDGVARLADFGLAHVAESDQRLTVTGYVVGTPVFMAPEQVSSKGGAVGPHTDVFGLGAVLYTMLTGRTPYDPYDPKLGEKILTGAAFPRPRSVSPSVPAAVEELILGAMRREPSERISMAEFAEGLERIRRGDAPVAQPLNPQRLALAAGLLGICLATVAVGTALARRGDRAAKADAAQRQLQSGRIATLNEALDRWDLPSARTQVDALDDLAPGLELPQAHVVRALTGDPRGALKGPWAAADRARLLAWSEDEQGLKEALLALSPERRRALAWSLSPQTAEPQDLVRGPVATGGWRALALARQALHEGVHPLAAAVLPRAQGGPALELERQLCRARLAIETLRPQAACGALLAAWPYTTSPLARARWIAWAAVVADAGPAVRLPLTSLCGSDPRALIQLAAPGLPRGPQERASGRLAAGAQAQALLAERGAQQHAARAALRTLAWAQAANDSPRLREAAARAALVLQDGERALREADAGLEAEPDDLALRLVRGRALVALDREDEAIAEFAAARAASSPVADLARLAEAELRGADGGPALLEPLLASVSLEPLARAREALATAFAEGDDEGRSAAELELSRLARPHWDRPTTLAALRLSATLSEERDPWHGYLACAADLQARARVSMRRAELHPPDSPQRRALYEHANGLLPELPALVSWHLELEPDSLDLDQVGQALSRDPSLLPLFVALLRERPEVVLKAPGSNAPLTRALRSLARGSIGLWPALVHASRGLAEQPQDVTLRLLRARALVDLASEDQRLIALAQQDVAWLRAGAPWIPDVALLALRVAPVESAEAALDEALAQGFWPSGLLKLPLDPGARRVVFELAGDMEEIRDRELKTVSAWATQGRFPRLCAAVVFTELWDADDRRGALDPLIDATADRLQPVDPVLAHALRAHYWGRRTTRDRETLREWRARADTERALARRLARPAGTPTHLRDPLPWLVWHRRRRAACSESYRVALDESWPAQPQLGFNLQAARAGGWQPGERTKAGPLPRQRELLTAWQQGDSAERAFAAGREGEALLAASRAAAASVESPGAMLWWSLIVKVRRRAWRRWKPSPEDARRAVEQGIRLARWTRGLSDQPLLWEGIRGDLLLERALLLPEGAERSRLCAEASRHAEAALGQEPKDHLMTRGMLLWRAARARTFAGDEAGALEALEELLALPKWEGDWDVAWGHQEDPLLPALQEAPERRKVLQAYRQSRLGW